MVFFKRTPLLRSTSSRGDRSSFFHKPRSRFARFLLFEKVDYFQWICTIAVFFFVVILFQAFLPGSVVDKSSDSLRGVSGLEVSRDLGHWGSWILEKGSGLCRLSCWRSSGERLLRQIALQLPADRGFELLLENHSWHWLGLRTGVTFCNLCWWVFFIWWVFEFAFWCFACLGGCGYLLVGACRSVCRCCAVADDQYCHVFARDWILNSGSWDLDFNWYKFIREFCLLNFDIVNDEVLLFVIPSGS